MRILRRIPFTIVLLLLLAVAAAISARLPAATLRGTIGIDLQAISHRQWWSLISADFFVDNPAQVIIVLITAALGVGAAEWLMGTGRAILAFLVTGVVASVVGLAALSVGVLTGEYWATAVHRLVTLDPLSPILGTIAAASAFASVLWRRRIRFAAVAYVCVFLLFSGQPSDLYRMIAVLTGIGVGALLTRRRIVIERWTSSHHESRVLLAVVASILALGPIITLAAHGRFGLLSPLGAFMTDGMPRTRSGGVPCSVHGLAPACNLLLGTHAAQGFSAVVLALVPLVIVLVGAYGLLNGRRVAVYLVASIAAADGVLAAFYFGLVPILGNPSHAASRAGQSPEFGAWIVANALLPLAFAVIVLSQRRHFPVRTTPRARTRFLVTMAVALVGVVGGYLAIGSLIGSQFRPVVGFMTLLEELPERFIPVSFLDAEQRDFVPVTFASRLLFHGVGPLLWATLLVALVLLLRSHRSGGLEAGDDESRFRALARRSSGSMSFPGTWTANSYWFSADGSAGIAYRVVNGCAVTTGEPVGDPLDKRDSVGQFIRFCDTNAWTPVFYSIHEEWARVLAELGWSSAVVAEETVIDPATWDMTGKKWQDVRSSVNRAAREGVHVLWGNWQDLTARTTNQIAEISELWVVEKKLPELGF
ncbi:MAG: phosphatidylglycerol lysyltransferase domain-containing protein, partial [Pseudolysinimonas sp.]